MQRWWSSVYHKTWSKCTRCVGKRVNSHPVEFYAGFPGYNRFSKCFNVEIYYRLWIVLGIWQPFVNNRSTLFESSKTKVDNTVKECKNNSFLKWLCWLLLQKGLDMTGVCMARVGHTHGSLGSLVWKHNYIAQNWPLVFDFSKVPWVYSITWCTKIRYMVLYLALLDGSTSWRMMTTSVSNLLHWIWQFSRDVTHPKPTVYETIFSSSFRAARKLRVILDKLELKKWLGAAQTSVEVLRTVRPWKEWFFGDK